MSFLYFSINKMGKQGLQKVAFPPTVVFFKCTQSVIGTSTYFLLRKKGAEDKFTSTQQALSQAMPHTGQPPF